LKLNRPVAHNINFNTGGIKTKKTSVTATVSWFIKDYIINSKELVKC
jgi:hypothetical protein